MSKHPRIREFLKKHCTADVRALHDLFGLLRSPLPEQFTTAELGEALAQPRRLAQKLAYVLREGGALTICGKEGNALRYQRAPLPPAD